MSAITVPTPAGANVGLGKFLIIATGAGLGVWAASTYLITSLPASVVNTKLFANFGTMEIVYGAAALLGGALGGIVASKLK